MLWINARIDAQSYAQRNPAKMPDANAAPRAIPFHLPILCRSDLSRGTVPRRAAYLFTADWIGSPINSSSPPSRIKQPLPRKVKVLLW